MNHITLKRHLVLILGSDTLGGKGQWVVLLDVCYHIMSVTIHWGTIYLVLGVITHHLGCYYKVIIHIFTDAHTTLNYFGIFITELKG